MLALVLNVRQGRLWGVREGRRGNAGEGVRGRGWGAPNRQTTHSCCPACMPPALLPGTAALKNACLLPPKPSTCCCPACISPAHTHTTRFFHAPHPQHPALPLQQTAHSCCPACKPAAPAFSTLLLPGLHPLPPQQTTHSCCPALKPASPGVDAVHSAKAHRYARWHGGKAGRCQSPSRQAMKSDTGRLQKVTFDMSVVIGVICVYRQPGRVATHKDVAKCCVALCCAAHRLRSGTPRPGSPYRTALQQAGGMQ